MKIWHYHPDTRVLLGEGSADRDALAWQGGVENWLVPAHATTVAPPAFSAGAEIPVFDSEGGWTVELVKPAAPGADPVPESPEERAARLLAEAQMQARSVLAATDWYVWRAMEAVLRGEEPKVIPPEILEQRDKAREVLSA